MSSSATDPVPPVHGGRPPRRPPSGGRSSGTTRFLVAVSGLAAVAFLASAAMVVYLITSEDSGDVKEGSALVLELSGPLTDAPLVGGFAMEPDDFPPLVTEIAGGIRRAAEDDRITGLYLDVDGVGGGYASLQEIRDALEVFRATGKGCVAYAETYAMGSYYLASACDEVVLAPSGLNLVMGLSASITYYAGTFEKIGVQAEMEHVGDFKSAVEPYERSGPSEAASEAMNAMLDSLWDQMVADIAEGRGMSEEALRAVIDAPALSPGQALEAGMVDALAFPEVVRAHLDTVGEDGWAARLGEPVAEEVLAEVAEQGTTLQEYLKDYRAEVRAGRDKIAVVHADGTIVSGDEDSGGLFGGAGLTDGGFRAWMTEAREDDAVKAVVVRVNSPGGSGLASDMMWREVERTRTAGKPVVVSMANYAASGGYFISAPADWIVAQPSTLTGSIGVFGGKFNLGGTYAKLGMTEHTYERGEEANLFSATEPFSEAGREAYRRFLSDFYEVFLGKVSAGREMSRDEVHAVAQGRVWTGSQALEHGLVDELGGLDVALAKARELASVESAGIVRFPEQKGFFDLLLEDLAEARGPSLAVELAPDPWGLGQEALGRVLLLERILRDGGVAALLPGDLRLE